MELRIIQKSTVIRVNFMEHYLRIFLPILEDSHNLVDLPGSHIASFPKINIKYLILDTLPLNPARLIRINVGKNSVDLMRSDAGINFSDQLSKSVQTNTLTPVRSDQLIQVDIFLLNLILNFQQKLFDIVTDLSFWSFLTGIPIFYQRMIKQFFPTHPPILTMNQTSLDKIFGM